MGICASCYDNANNDNEQKVQQGEEREEKEEDKMDQGEEEDSQDALVHHQDQQIHHHDHYHLHQQPKGRKSMCRRCNLRLLTLIHVPPKEDTSTVTAEAVEEKSEGEQDEKNLGSTPSTYHSSVQSSQMSRAAGDTSDTIKDAGVANPEYRKSRKPHRDLHVSWRKGHGDFIDHLMFGWHH